MVALEIRQNLSSKMLFIYIVSFFPAVFAKNFHVKAVMKTSVLLSWEIPENYNSALPFKVSYFPFVREKIQKPEDVIHLVK